MVDTASFLFVLYVKRLPVDSIRYHQQYSLQVLVGFSHPDRLALDGLHGGLRSLHFPSYVAHR